MPAKPNAKLQALVNAGLILEENLGKLPDDLKMRLESLSETEITHLIAAKAKLGGKHTLGSDAMVNF